MNMSTEVSNSSVCLVVYPYDTNWILGNIAQQNFLIEFDLGEHILSNSHILHTMSDFYLDLKLCNFFRDFFVNETFYGFFQF